MSYLAYCEYGPAIGTHRERGKEEGPKTPGEEAGRPMLKKLATPGESWSKSPRIEDYGEQLWMDYAPTRGTRPK